MEFLKDKTSITQWLIKLGINGFTLKPDEQYGFKVNVGHGVYLSDKGLDFIPVKFNMIYGNFYCSKNNLTSLEFAPLEVENKFDCSFNLLSSLKGGPEFAGDFSCYNNRLTNLEFCPKFVGKDFYARFNQLDTIEFLPEIVGGYFEINQNPLLGQYQHLFSLDSVKKALLAEKLDNSLKTKDSPLKIKI